MILICFGNSEAWSRYTPNINELKKDITFIIHLIFIFKFENIIIRDIASNNMVGER